MIFETTIFGVEVTGVAARYVVTPGVGGVDLFLTIAILIEALGFPTVFLVEVLFFVEDDGFGETTVRPRG